MSTTPSSISSRVYFEGPWRPADRERVADAVADFESECDDETPFPDAPSWVCVAYDMGATALYCAHRPHLSGVLSARSAPALVEAIRDAHT